LRSTTIIAAALLIAAPTSACAASGITDADGPLPPLVLQIPSGRVSIDLGKIARRRLPPSRRPVPRRAPAPRRPTVVVSPPPAPPPPMADSADRTCLQALNGWGVPYRSAGTLRGVKTPIEITGPIRGVRLVARAGRAPTMDCELARALAEAAPIFQRHGVSALSYSGAYVYRNVAGTSRLSGHAYGLAIDVHGLETNLGRLEILRDFPRDRARWEVPRDNPRACTGEPPTAQGRLVRSLACELRAYPAFHMILSPDYNEDHRDHLHLEAYPSRPTQLLSSTGDKPSVVHRGRGGRRSRR
jgi:hypothetical protein